MMGRTAYRDGADDAQRWGSPNKRRYSVNPSYAEGFDDYMKEHPACVKCGGGEVEKEGDKCTECMAQAGGGNDSSTQKED